jgi:fibronectin type 3 domain-containing protein
MKRTLHVLVLAITAFAVGCGTSNSINGVLSKAPSAPGSLVATAGSGQASLFWTAPPGSTTFNIYYSTTKGVTTSTGTKVTGVSLPLYQLLGLTNGKTYYFVVTAVNPAGESAISNEASASPVAVRPGVPTNVTASPNNQQVTLNWTPVFGADTYNVYYSTSPGVTTANGTKVSGLTSPTFTLTGLTNGVTYYFIVTSVNTGGESIAASGSVSAIPQLLPPANLAAAPGNAKVALSWTAALGAASYNIYYSTTTGVTTANGTKIGGVAAISFNHTGLTNDATYYYIVTSVLGAQESVPTSQVSATPEAPPPAPAGLTAISGKGMVGLTWAPANHATSYNIYYSTTAGVTPANGTRVVIPAGTSFTVTGLTNQTPYYFIVTGLDVGGESAASNQVTATPTNGVIANLTPGTDTIISIQYSVTTELTWDFYGNSVSQPETVTVLPIDQSAMPAPMTKATSIFFSSFSIGLDPSLNAFNVPIGMWGNVASNIHSGTTLNLAYYKNGAWVDVATFVVGANGAFTENLASLSLPGLLNPGTYLLYEPATGSNLSVSNLGVVLMADDGYGMADNSNGIQVIRLYDAKGNLLATPTISYLDYPGQPDLDGAALTPDGSEGIIVDGTNDLSFLSAVQTGTPVASSTVLDISTWGSDGDSVAILPNGDEAVVSEDTSNPANLLIVSGILSGNTAAADLITVPATRDGVVISWDGATMLARGPSGLTVFSVTPITPAPGSLGGTVSNKYTQIADFVTLGTHGSLEDGRDGMALSLADSTRAVVVNPTTETIVPLTGLPASPVVGTPVSFPSGVTTAYSVAISPDGKLAVVGTNNGLLLYSGVDTGKLVEVGVKLYTPNYSLNGQQVALGAINTLGITLDQKYVAAADSTNKALVVIPLSASGFGAPASVLGNLAIPDNDQLLIH